MMWARSGGLAVCVGMMALWLGLMAGMAPGQQTPPVDRPGGAVVGMVALGDTGAPAVGATVFLMLPPTPRPTIVDGEYIARDEPARGAFSGKTDAAGRVVMRDVRPGEYRLVAQVEGYISPEEYVAPWALAPVDAAGRAGLPAFVQTVRVEAGKETRFALQLERGGVIEGRVRYADGRPAYRGGSVDPGVSVDLLVRRPEGGFGYCATCTVRVDEDGRYRIDGLPVATYVVRVAMGGEMVPVQGGEEGTQGLVMYAGGTQRLGRAETVEIKGREVVRKDVVLPVAGLHTVSGRVIGPDGRPIERGLVRLAPTGETDRSGGPLINSIATPIEVDGRFHLQSVLPDTYTLSLEEGASYQMIGLTADGKGLRMRVVPFPYAPVSETVTVGGSDPAEVVLRVAAAK